MAALLSSLLGAPTQALAQPTADASIRVVRTWTLDNRDAVPHRAPAPSAARLGHLLRLDMAVQSGARWAPDVILAATRRAAAILRQCGVQTIASLHEFAGPDRYRHLSSPVSRELAHSLALRRPAIFFVDDTLHEPAFDAEAIGRANARRRPEMADTVWVTAGTRDLPIALAHELMHVLADSGAHSDAAGNLMREETATDHTQLTSAQCEAAVTVGAANGLLERAASKDGGN